MCTCCRPENYAQPFFYQFVCVNTFAQNIDKLYDKWISRVRQLIHYRIFVEEEEGEQEEETFSSSPSSFSLSNM